MSAPDAIERYFTEQIVGVPQTIEIGSHEGVRKLSDRGVLVDFCTDQVALYGMAVASLWSADAPAVTGRPYTVAALRQHRRWLLGGGLVLWTVVCFTVFHLLSA